ncbi:ATP-binding protein [Mesorhizobium sp. YR577]|uniref:nSTAND1 domain-containing NTPase n=1 Tax=Mesorhizobium sp. YR577 TaxID=1884373 RepID=UPI0008E10A5B|nr:ATP-binding protein [Mesorhizobium sp. YR577]SFU14132.1 hypothetical protein SAMN05518861_1157 [Mesorhizobium sp. YR577]
MLGGGFADKKGNEYEARWTLVEALRVLRGMAEEIRWEPFNEEADGFEFRITGNGLNEWHQCKRQASHGSWTITGLTNAGVLKAFAGKLADPNTICVFVSSDPAPDFEKLIEKANAAETVEDFYGPGGVGKGDRKAIEDLNKVWSDDKAKRLDWLKRCRVEVTSETMLFRRLEEVCGLLFRTPPVEVIDRMIRLLSANLGKRFTRIEMTDAVASLGIEWLAHFDGGLEGRIVSATDEYLGSLMTTIAGIEIETDDIRNAVQTALEDARPITVLAGSAGSGKSVVLSHVIAEARSRGWPVLAFRIDRYLEVQSLPDLGRILLEAEESPVSAFGNRTIVRPSLLVIDQIDAVSEASGRSPRMRDLFFRMVNQAAHFPNMRVVAACRSYDLDGDSRLEMLSKAAQVTSITLNPLDWKDAVQPALNRLGLEKRTFTEREQQLLSVPINLQLFASVMLAGDAPAGELSSVRLFDMLLEIRGRQIRTAGYSWTPEAALGAIARSMSDNQHLTAPVVVLDTFSGAIDVLCSHGLITAIRDKLQFAHESYFDHVFSRHFISIGQSVHALLTSNEQRLFRRTQVRQIFSRLRDIGERRYLPNLRAVMESGDVRYLVKDAIAYWLSEVEGPTADERLLVESWFAPGHLLERSARVVFNGSYWLLTLLEGGTIKQWVSEGGDRKEFAFWLLNKAAVKHSARVAAFMRCWWSAAPDARAGELKAWFERLYPDGPIGSLEALYGDVIAKLPDTEIKPALEDNFELGSWVQKSPSLAAHILGLWLRRWMVAFPADHPFGQSKHNSDYWIQELVKAQPGALLEAMLEPFAEALRREQVALASGDMTYPTLRPPHYEHDQQYQRCLLGALEAVAGNEPGKAEEFLRLLGTGSDVAMFAQLHAIAANGAGLKHLLIPLLSYKRIFKVGDSDSDWIPFAKAAAAAMPFLPEADRTHVEEAVLAYRPEYEWAREYLCRDKAGELVLLANDTAEYVRYQLKLSGRDERAILRTIGPDHLSERARRRLAELDRKFAGAPLPEAYGIRGGWVRSPIPSEKAAFMSDTQWLRAIAKYDGSERHVYEPDGVIGGRRQLASVLQERTKEEPIRFVELLERLPLTASPNYAEAVISGLRESEVEASLVVRAIKAALCWPVREYDRIISWTIQKHPEAAADPDVLEFLLKSAEYGEASDTTVTTTSPKAKEKLSARELLERNDDLVFSGINGERGAAYEALASVLWKDETALRAILDLLERRTRHEPLASVRICMVHLINSVGKYEPDKAVDLFQRVVGTDFRILRGYAAEHVLDWLVFRRSDIVAGFIDGMLKSERTGIRAYGHFLESLLALIEDERNDEFVAGFKDNPVRRQMAALRASGNAASGRYGSRALSWLQQLIQDEDSLVRADTMHIAWEKLLDDGNGHTAFIRTYIASPTFSDDSDSLMRALEKRASQFPDLTFVAVERVLELADGWTADARRGHFSTLHHLSRVLIELYRAVEVESTQEKKILNLFDQYLARDLFDVRGEIGRYERH